MRTRLNLAQGMLVIFASGTALAQSVPRVAPIPRDPLELAVGHIQIAGTAERDAMLQVLARARNSYALRNLHQPWDLKVNFTVDSQGLTSYDGDWQMEDVFSPGQGLHWTAQSAGGYAIAGIFAGKETYAQAAGSVIPLRLQEARALLYNPIPSVSYAASGTLRTTTAALAGSPLTCILLTRSRNTSNMPDQRDWNESEECIDSQSGLLRMHSDVPGRYAVYDYANAPQIGSHVLPRTVTVTEGGRVVSTIAVESLQVVNSVDPSLFIPTDAMKAAGPATVMTAATKISRIQGESPFSTGMTLRPVCVFGLVSKSGRLVEAHSLQPSDPDSEAAVKDAEAIDFSPSISAATGPQQHFVFILEKFVSNQ